MKKNIIISALLILFGIGCSVCAGEIKFVQVSDVHYSNESEYPKKVLEAAIKDINKLDNVSFVIFTGDNINDPNPEYVGEFTKIANKLNVPYYVVIGNHDVFKSNGLSKERYFELVKENNFFFKYKTPNYVFKKDEFVFIVVDGAKEVIPGTTGYFKKNTLDWLEKQLTKYSKNPVIICQHFPLLEPKPSKSHNTYKAEEYLDLLKKHSNVIALLSGHYHMNSEKMQDGIYHINSPSLLALPNQYKVIDIVTTKGFSPMIYTQLRELDVK